MPIVEFHFDFGSPNAYLAHLLIPQIEQRTGAPFEYVPVLLGGVFKLTNNRSPMESFQGVKNKLEYQRLETQRFIRRHGITNFAMNPFFPVNTLMIMRGAVARAALDQSGLDGARLIALTQEPAVKDRLLANTQKSVERGAFGSPTFFVGDEMFFGKDRLRDVEEEILGSSLP